MENNPSIITRAAEWAACGERGMSSETIWAVLMGVPADKIESYLPADAGDFNRCALLLELIPEWLPRLHEVAEAFPEWRLIVQNWGTLYARLLDLRAARASMDTLATHGAYRRFDEELYRCTREA